MASRGVYRFARECDDDYGGADLPTGPTIARKTRCGASYNAKAPTYNWSNSIAAFYAATLSVIFASSASKRLAMCKVPSFTQSGDLRHRRFRQQSCARLPYRLLLRAARFESWHYGIYDVFYNIHRLLVLQATNERGREISSQSA